MRLRLTLVLAKSATFVAAAAPAFAAHAASIGTVPADGGSFSLGDLIAVSAGDALGDDTKVRLAPPSSPNPKPYAGIIADEVWFRQLAGGPIGRRGRTTPSPIRPARTT